LGGNPTLAATANVLGTVVISQGIPVLHAQTGVIPVINNINKAWGVIVTASVTHAAVPHYQSSRKKETLSFYTFEHIR
jgi:hypothetical protein